MSYVQIQQLVKRFPSVLEVVMILPIHKKVKCEKQTKYMVISIVWQNLWQAFTNVSIFTENDLVPPNQSGLPKGVFVMKNYHK